MLEVQESDKFIGKFKSIGEYLCPEIYLLLSKPRSERHLYHSSHSNKYLRRFILVDATTNELYINRLTCLEAMTGPSITTLRRSSNSSWFAAMLLDSVRHVDPLVVAVNVEEC